MDTHMDIHKKLCRLNTLKELRERIKELYYQGIVSYSKWVEYDKRLREEINKLIDEIMNEFLPKKEEKS